MATGPQSAQDQLEWKKQTDAALGIRQLDMRDIPAKIELASELTGLPRAEALEKIRPLIDQTAAAIQETGQAMTSANACNQRWGNVDLEYDTDDLTFRVKIKALEALAQVEALKAVGESVTLHARRLREQAAAQQQRPVQPPPTHAPAPLAPR
jgi:hypothetical protein